jgi:hypothetical protein
MSGDLAKPNRDCRFDAAERSNVSQIWEFAGDHGTDTGKSRRTSGEPGCNNKSKQLLPSAAVRTAGGNFQQTRLRWI